MKKITLLVLLLIFSIGILQATDKRVQALGGNPYMVLGDDASIQLFPQRINDSDLIYFQDIHTANPDYLLVVGDSTRTWGFYGGATEKDDYFNVIRSLSSTSAVRIGLRFGITSRTIIEDDKETSPSTSEIKLSQTNIMFDMEYGMDKGSKEFSTSFMFGLTPDNINQLWGFPGPHGTFTGDYVSPGGNSSDEGKASSLAIALQTKVRDRNGLFFFDNSYAVFGLNYQGGASEFTSATTKLEDQSSSQFGMYSIYKLFNNQTLANDKIFLVYGIGGELFFNRQADEVKLSGAESTDTDMEFGIVAPTINIGLEADLKYTTLRFGMERRITSLGYSSQKEVYISGATDDEDTSSRFTLGGNGAYVYNAGMGFNYGQLQLDILVNNNFWITGPQMIFNDLYGTLGVCADLVYTY